MLDYHVPSVLLVRHKEALWTGLSFACMFYLRLMNIQQDWPTWVLVVDSSPWSWKCTLGGTGPQCYCWLIDSLLMVQEDQMFLWGESHKFSAILHCHYHCNYYFLNWQSYIWGRARWFDTYIHCEVVIKLISIYLRYLFFVVTLQIYSQ